MCRFLNITNETFSIDRTPYGSTSLEQGQAMISLINAPNQF